MSKYTNTGQGAHGINVEDDLGKRTIWIEPGETVEIADDKTIADKALHDDLKKGEAAAKSAAADAAAAAQPAS